MKVSLKSGRVIEMNNIDVANGIVFQKLTISKESFDDRLICQKKIYLLQSLGTDLGYTYNWYVHGPYSPSLTNYVYNNLDVLESYDFGRYSLSSVAENNIKKVNALEKDKRVDLKIASWYELLASLLYIFNNRGSWKIDDNNTLVDTLIKQKPQFNREQCEDAFNTLRKRGFIQAEV